MENIDKKINILHSALSTLERAIYLFDSYGQKALKEPSIENDELVISMRDSMIQRFEYCTDLFWKMLKVYLEEVEKVTLHTYSPKSIIREAVQARVLSEQEGALCIDMIKKRNETFHIYREEVAEQIAGAVPDFFALMQIILDRIIKRIAS